MQQNNKKIMENFENKIIDSTPENQIQSNLNMNILFLSDLPSHVNEEDIRAFFKDYSEKIKLISLNAPKINMMSSKMKSPSCSVIFSDSKSADLAKRNLNLKKIRGKTVRIMWHTKDKNIIENPQTNIYVKNIPDLVTPRQVLEHFSQFGEVISAKIPENEEGNHFGFGYINYMDIDSAKNAIESENGKKIWNSVLEVMPFIHMKERINTLISNNSNILYLRDFPEKFSEENIVDLVRNFGEIQTCRIINDKSKIPYNLYAVLIFPNTEITEHVKISLNNLQVEGKFLKAENYKTKEEKYGMFGDFNLKNPEGSNLLPNYNSYMNQNNPNNNFLPKLSSSLTNNNLHIKNIPFDADENDLTNCFKKFGEIKSVKIQRINLVTKVNDQYKEIPTSQGFGYICFSKHDEALKAKEAMDGKFLPKFEMWKRPLIIDFFLPKNQRKINNNTYSINIPQNYYENFPSNSNQNPINLNPNEMEIIPINTNENIQQFYNPEVQFMQNIKPTQNTNNQDNFNMQGMYQNLPQNNFQQNPQNFPNLMMNNFNPHPNMNLPRGQNPQFYDNKMINIMPNVNVQSIPQNPQNMFYNQKQNQFQQQNMMKMYGQKMAQPIPQGNYLNNKFNNQFNNPLIMNPPQQKVRQQEDKNEINLDYLNSMEDNESKREYLGEIIFKKIENHHLSQKYEFSINKIGKTTGMILAIDDLKVIIDICKNEESLTAYIQEAYELLKESEN